jgi:hypothetical protein
MYGNTKNPTKGISPSIGKRHSKNEPPSLKVVCVIKRANKYQKRLKANNNAGIRMTTMWLLIHEMKLCFFAKVLVFMIKLYSLYIGYGF